MLDGANATEDLKTQKNIAKVNRLVHSFWRTFDYLNIFTSAKKY